MKELENVKALVDHLNELGPNRSIIVDDCGDTYPLTTEDIALWNERDPESPVAMFAYPPGSSRRKEFCRVYVLEVFIGKLRFSILAQDKSIGQCSYIIKKLSKRFGWTLRKVPRRDSWTSYDALQKRRYGYIVINRRVVLIPL